MITRVDQYEFRESFESSDDYRNNFSRSGLVALFEYLEELEESTGEQIEFDMIAIACDYSEHKSALEVALEHGYDDSGREDDRTDEQAALEWLQDRTSVIQFDGGVIISSF